jgi:hypothetical protein
MKSEIKSFNPQASLPKQGLVLIFDLEGFSKFFAQPDVQNYVPKYLNHIINAIKNIIYGGKSFWNGQKESNMSSLPKPIHELFEPL